MTRTIKIVLGLALASWGLIGGIANLSHYNADLAAVARVMAMSDQMLEPSSWWASHAVRHPVVIHISFAFIYLSKLATGIFCALGAYKMWQARAADARSFQAAKSFVVLGAGISIFMLFFGFIVIAGEWFYMAQAANGLAVHQAVFIYMAGLSLISFYVNQEDL